jgi:peptidoglycan hydrolase-like protein with peptidoglycan-binding domain
MLTDFEFFEGEVNGLFGLDTEQAVKKFQETLTFLPPNGIIDA